MGVRKEWTIKGQWDGQTVPLFALANEPHCVISRGTSPMGISADFKHNLWHVIETTLLAFVMLAAAIGIAVVEIWCEKNQMPKYLCISAFLMGAGLVVFDAVLLLGTVGIFTVRRLSRTYRDVK